MAKGGRRAHAGGQRKPTQMKVLQGTFRADRHSAEVTVPAKCWKVVAVLDENAGEADDATKIGPHTRLIGVIMPNEQSVGHGWAKYRVSVGEIENLTGYRFFDQVPADVIDLLKNKVDNEHVPPPRPRHAGS